MTGSWEVTLDLRSCTPRFLGHPVRQLLMALAVTPSCLPQLSGEASSVYLISDVDR